jgi:hypothetical protein
MAEASSKRARDNRLIGALAWAQHGSTRGHRSSRSVPAELCCRERSLKQQMSGRVDADGMHITTGGAVPLRPGGSVTGYLAAIDVDDLAGHVGR